MLYLGVALNLIWNFLDKSFKHLIVGFSLFYIHPHIHGKALLSTNINANEAFGLCLDMRILSLHLG